MRVKPYNRGVKSAQETGEGRAKRVMRHGSAESEPTEAPRRAWVSAEGGCTSGSSVCRRHMSTQDPKAPRLWIWGYTCVLARRPGHKYETVSEEGRLCHKGADQLLPPGGD